MPFFRPEKGGANFRSNSQLVPIQLVPIPPILTRYSEHLKKRQLVTGEQLRNETDEKEHGKQDNYLSKRKE